SAPRRFSSAAGGRGAQNRSAKKSAPLPLEFFPAKKHTLLIFLGRKNCATIALSRSYVMHRRRFPLQSLTVTGGRSTHETVTAREPVVVRGKNIAHAHTAVRFDSRAATSSREPRTGEGLGRPHVRARERREY